eukprot:1487935-Rhodomonas_salina.2
MLQIDRPSNAVDDSAPAPMPAELTASTAMHLWFGLMQAAIADGADLGTVDSIGYTFLHYACLEGKYSVRVPPLCLSCGSAERIS